MGQTHIWRRFLLLAKAIPPIDATTEEASSGYYLSNEDILKLANYNLNGAIVFGLFLNGCFAEPVLVPVKVALSTVSYELRNRWRYLSGLFLRLINHLCFLTEVMC